MRRIRQALSVAVCTLLVIVAVPLNAEANVDELVMMKAASIVTCAASGCSASASFSRYGKITNYRNITDSGHEECIEAFYYCPKGHTTVKEVWIGNQKHSWTGYDDLGHATVNSETHHYRVKCGCGYGQDVYIQCDYWRTGVHAKPL